MREEMPNAGIDEWAERCLGTWPQLQATWKYMREYQKLAAAELREVAHDIEMAHCLSKGWSATDPKPKAEYDRLMELANRLQYVPYVKPNVKLRGDAQLRRPA